MLTENELPIAQPETSRVAVVIPIPNDPDWSIFSEIPEEIPIIVVDDSDGKLAAPPRDNVRYFDYAAQQAEMGEHYPANPHRSAATRNFGHYLAHREGFDVVIALDYDCRPRPGWLSTHLAQLQQVSDAPALRAAWINTIGQDGFFARGFPYEERYKVGSEATRATAQGEVKLNMGVWDNILDLNGIDKVQAEPPREPGWTGAATTVALGMIPLCGMNTAFRVELTPAYYFLPDVWVGGRWQLSRHDDIWGGYVLQRLMAKRGDLVAFGAPTVEHTRQSNMNRVLVIEHWMHLLSRGFYELCDEAATGVAAGTYAEMFGTFADEYSRLAPLSREPTHYRDVYIELGSSMRRWAACFR